LSSNTESDLDTNVVRPLKQPEGCGPSEFSPTLFRIAARLWVFCVITSEVSQIFYSCRRMYGLMAKSDLAYETYSIIP